MLKRRVLFTVACAAICASPLLALLGPEHGYGFAPTQASLANWQRGLDFGLALLAFLAWRLNQNRLAVAAVGLACAVTGVLWATASGQSSLAVTNFWLLSVPSGLAICLLPRDGLLNSSRTLAGMVLCFLPAGLAWAIGTSSPIEAAHWLAWPWPIPGHPSLLASLSLPLFALCASRRMQERVAAAWLALGGGLLGQAALAWGLALSVSPPLLVARLWLASGLAAAACLALGLFLLYWQRVYLDELTAIPNRRALDERMSNLEGSYSLAMVDIDHFKNFNDTYGHAQGDDVLRLVAEHLRSSTGGRAYRYGGEEFCVLATDLDAKAMVKLMDLSRVGLQKRRFTVRRSAPAQGRTGASANASDGGAAGHKVQVTVSVGVAERDRQHAEASQVLKLADEGLYAAKAAGRNT
ncbi:MAG: diguanylate cyclase, partial [bacterium]